MTDQEVFEKLLLIFKDATDDPDRDYSKVTPKSHLFDELGISSISAIYMALEIESTFGFAISNEEASSLVTVQDLIDLIQKKAG